MGFAHFDHFWHPNLAKTRLSHEPFSLGRSAKTRLKTVTHFDTFWSVFMISDTLDWTVFLDSFDCFMGFSGLAASEVSQTCLFGWGLRLVGTGFDEK